MKKILAILLAAMMVFALAACGDNNTTDPDKDNPGSSQSGENNDSKGGNTQGGTEQGFKMPTLNSYDTFPSSDYWTALGLPADFTIEITEMEFSSKNSIYPLDAKDGNMFDCVVADNQTAYKTLADALWNAGIKGTSVDGDEAAERSEVDEHDIDVNVYKAYWKLNGEVMSIEVRARDGSNRVSVTVKYSPED